MPQTYLMGTVFSSMWTIWMSGAIGSILDSVLLGEVPGNINLGRVYH